MIKRAHNAARRKFEFMVVRDQVKRHKQRLIDRLNRNLLWTENGCALYGVRQSRPYPVINFYYKRKHVQITAARVFMILKNCAPLPIGYEAGHTCDCSGCVVHLELQHFTKNAALSAINTNGKKNDCPF